MLTTLFRTALVLVMLLALHLARGLAAHAQPGCPQPTAFAMSEALRQPACTQELYLRQQRLEQVPAGLADLPYLRRLHLETNHLRELPDELTGLDSLRELFANENQLRTLPADLGHLGRLRQLQLDRNELAELPPTVAGLDSLRYLVLAWNRFSSLPEHLGSLGQLDYLDFSHNQLLFLPASVGGAAPPALRRAQLQPAANAARRRG